MYIKNGKCYDCAGCGVKVCEWCGCKYCGLGSHDGALCDDCLSERDAGHDFSLYREKKRYDKSQRKN